MKRLVRITPFFLLILIVLSAVFFMWASSPQLLEKDYNKLISNSNEKNILRDSVHSIVTYNIGYLSGMTNNKAVEKPKSLFETNLKNVKHLFSLLQPDIIALQEIDYGASRSYKINQQNELATLGYHYIAQAINWDEHYVPFPYWPPSVHFGEMLSGQSILSKFPLVDHKRIVLERVPDNPFYRDALYLDRLAQVVKATINDKELILINIHLEAFDKDTRIRQFHDVLHIFNQYATDYPTILLGDFNSNARDRDAIIQELLTNNNVGNAAFNKDSIENTFNTTNPFKRIDYIFYTNETIEYIDGTVLNDFGTASDHLPVYMKFKFK
ncbi:MAG: endonuclease/exonuclease/phosphatase [Flavobacteriaceae bacterium]|nr:endonuclease/exonuclease/phosphatase [Flavobacteriaceae bacterium]